MTTYSAVAADFSKNPYGPVYDNAITEKVAGKVIIHPVSYTVDGIRVAANVYTPAGYDPKKSYPAIVVAHPNGGVKEQVAGLFAEKLAGMGYITVAADARYQGASGGEPRHTDKPANRIEDINGMVDYIRTYPGVNANEIGALGICGGGRYTERSSHQGCGHYFYVQQRPRPQKRLPRFSDGYDPAETCSGCRSQNL